MLLKEINSNLIVYIIFKYLGLTLVALIFCCPYLNVLMLKDKCQKYWPSPNESFNKRGIIVESLKEEKLPHYTIRNLILQKVFKSIYYVTAKRSLTR